MTDRELTDRAWDMVRRSRVYLSPEEQADFVDRLFSNCVDLAEKLGEGDRARLQAAWLNAIADAQP